MSPKTDTHCREANEKAMFPIQVKNILVSMTSAHDKFQPSRALIPELEMLAVGVHYEPLNNN